MHILKKAHLCLQMFTVQDLKQHASNMHNFSYKKTGSICKEMAILNQHISTAAQNMVLILLPTSQLIRKTLDIGKQGLPLDAPKSADQTVYYAYYTRFQKHIFKYI